jgi:hypothetical protein
LNADYQATEKLSLNFGVIYNNAEGTMDGIALNEPFDPYNNVDDPGLPGANYLLGRSYADFEGRIGLVEDYSDLEYQQIDVTLGGTYSFTDRLYTTAMATYRDFNSDEDYVYGDEDGTAYYGYLGVGYRF